MKHWHLLFWTLLVSAQGFPNQRSTEEAHPPRINSHGEGKANAARDCNTNCNTKSASSIAQKAAAEAKAAQAAQNAAGAQAAHMVSSI